MRLPWNIIFACLAAARVALAAADAWIYTFDTHQSSPSRSQAQLTAREASLILSSRIGSSSDLSIGVVGDELISKIDQYGGYQRSLFDTRRSVPKVLVEVEGLDGRMKAHDLPPDLEVSKLPSLHRGIMNTHSEKCVRDLDIGSDVAATITLNPTAATKCIKTEPLPFAEALRSIIPNTSAQVLINLSKNTDIHAVLNSITLRLSDAAIKDGLQSTLILYPSGSHPPTAKPTDYINRRRAPEEEPIPNTTAPPSSPLTILQNATIPKPLNGTIRLCYSSDATCQSSTNNCSSHGQCRLLRTDKSSANPECWSCSCGRTTVRVNDDGSEKTVQWGGNACQKKDVSMEFWLFAGFGVAISSAIAWGIGLLYGMGGGELPSVLGAGVAGPKAQR